ncbi:hypothetical protein [Vibrio crassostreae]|uniref:hypothetical protein n=1 Tax=Vibrio crassostreae TaxID=246167 RepID=UPI001B30A8E9|nr:hypothetical protein [Vibrio crassostreae]
MTFSVGDTVSVSCDNGEESQGEIEVFLSQVNFGDWIAVEEKLLRAVLENEYAQMKDERRKNNLPHQNRFKRISCDVVGASHVRICMGFYSKIFPVKEVTLVKRGGVEAMKLGSESFERRMKNANWVWE